MIIKVLAENTTNNKTFGSEHGLSLYIETVEHKLLFDTGASTLFAQNAAKMNVDLSAVDLAAISHGHNDHGGGLKAFLSMNSKAKVYLHKQAFGKHYSRKPDGENKYIGLDESLMTNDRLIFTQSRYVIDHELELFSCVKRRNPAPSGNRGLLIKVGETFVQDDFSHEQSLVIHEGGKLLLIAGCSHNGIVNILEQFFAGNGCMPDYVIGGFHLYSRSANSNENPDIVYEIGRYLLTTESKFYTCHCTGIESYNRLKAVMGDNIDYLSAGDSLII